MSTTALRHAGCAALIVYGLSILGTLIAPRPTVGQRLPSGVWARRDVPPGSPLRGFAISLHHTDRLALYLAAIDEMAALGFNCVEVATPAFQTNGASQQIRIETGTQRGPTRDQLVTVLRHARQRGLVTALMPQILLTHPRGNEWRGKIHPDQWDPWWQSYRTIVDYFLEIANESSVDIFVIGSELLSTERHADRWTQLVGHARKRFNGWLSYSTNWDHYHVPTIWPHVDMIGVSGYWDLTRDARDGCPTPEDLKNRWRQIRRKLLDFAATQDRPILFTEIGYPSLPWALKAPWNYVNDRRTPADHDAQVQGYRAFLSAWDDLLTTQPNGRLLTGVFFYAWDPYHQGGADDGGYGVRGKPALKLLKQWLAASR